MTELNSRGLALARAAEAMLRTLDSSEVTLRLPAAPAANAGDRELGLAAPVVAEFPISPVVARSTAAGVELLFAPSSLAAYLDERRESADEFFAAVLAIVHQGRTLRVCRVTTDTFAGAAYLYRVVAAE